jgi:Ca2+-binding RTX toxin-like protein
MARKDKEMKMEDLDKVVGGTNPSIIGTNEDETLIGGDGADHMEGRDGNDIMFGGYGDNADDVAFGQDGNDAFLWGATSEDGNDTFHGGEGNDTLLLGGVSNIHGGWLAGEFSIELKDSMGMPVDPGTIEAMFDADGNLNLPDNYSGTITANGHTLDFTGVEKISAY